MIALPEISIIVPVYNSEKTVAGSLHSLFVQTLRDIEVIAVNDASTDKSGEILEQVSAKDPRLRVLHLDTNVGVHEARVAGLKLSRAPYIGFLDADDFAKPEMFEVMLQACVKHDAEISICGIDLCSPRRKKLGVKLRFKNDKTEDLNIFEKFCRIEYGTGALWNKLYERELLLRHALTSFKWRQDANEDTLVNIGCFLEAKRVHLVSKQLCQYVINPESATRTVDEATSFTRNFRAYAIAVELFQNYGREVLDKITELYARQLRYGPYKIENRADLVIHEQSLNEAVNLISERYPIGLALFSNSGWLEKYESESLMHCVKSIMRNMKFVLLLMAKFPFK